MTSAPTQLSRFVYPGDVDSAMTEAECRRLWELAEGKVCLEMGSWRGRSAISMAQSAQVVHCVDHFQGDEHSGFGSTLADFFSNIQRYGLMDKIVPHIGTFEQVLPLFDQDSFGLIFCDGLHTAAATQMQAGYATWLWPELNGIIAFHDYSDADDLYEAGFRVKEVVDEIFGQPDEVVDTLAVVRAG